MTASNETCQATVEKYLGLLNDSTKVGSDFAALYAPDGVLCDPVGSEPRTGTADIAAFYDSINGERKATLDQIRIAGGQAAFLFTLVTKAGGATITISPLDVMEINEDGSIAKMSAYWNDQDIQFS